MMIHLIHPVHGAKIAYVEAEAAMDEKNGWMRVAQLETVPEVSTGIVPMDPYFKAQLEEASTVPVKRKPGRPKKVA